MKCHCSHASMAMAAVAPLAEFHCSFDHRFRTDIIKCIVCVRECMFGVRIEFDVCYLSALDSVGRDNDDSENKYIANRTQTRRGERERTFRFQISTPEAIVHETLWTLTWTKDCVRQRLWTWVLLLLNIEWMDDRNVGALRANTHPHPHAYSFTNPITVTTNVDNNNDY